MSGRANVCTSAGVFFHLSTVKCVSHVASHRRTTLQPSVYTSETQAVTDKSCSIHLSASSSQKICNAKLLLISCLRGHTCFFFSQLCDRYICVTACVSTWQPWYKLKCKVIKYNVISRFPLVYHKGFAVRHISISKIGFWRSWGNLRRFKKSSYLSSERNHHGFSCPGLCQLWAHWSGAKR